MNPRSPTLTVLLALALFAVGVVSGQWLRRSTPGRASAATDAAARPASLALAPKEAWEIALDSQQGAARWLPALAALENGDRSTYERFLARAGDSRSMVRMIISGWTTHDPEGVYLYLLDQAKKVARGEDVSALSLMTSVFTSQLHSLPPDAVLAMLEKQPDSPWRREVQQALLSSLIDSQPERGLALAIEFKSDTVYPGEGFEAWAAENPTRAAAQLARLLPSDARDSLQESLAEAWAGTDPAGALAWASSLGGASGQSALATVVKTWAAQDPEKAAATVAGLPATQRARVATGLVEAWSQSDPSAAMTWIQNTLKSEARSSAMFACIEGGLANDPQKVADALARLDDTSLQRQAAPTLVEGWARKDPAAATAWTLALPEGKTRMLALDRIAPAWVQTDLPAVREFIATTPAATLPPSLASAVGQALAATDPQGALAFANGLAPTLRAAAQSGALESWTKTAPQEAAAYVTRALEGPARREGVISVTLGWLSRAPDAAMAWAATLPAEDKSALADRLRRTWLSENTKRSLLESLQGAPTAPPGQ